MKGEQKFDQCKDLLHPDAEVGKNINLFEINNLEDFSPIQIAPEELTVITSGRGKVEKLNALGIHTAERLLELDETGWWWEDTDSGFDMPVLSAQLLNMLRQKSKGARVSTRYYGGTDTTVIGLDEGNHVIALDSTGEKDKKIAKLRKIKLRNLPLCCIHSWQINDSEDPMFMYVFSILLKYDLDDRMYEEAMKGIQAGSKMPMGVNLADPRWQSNLVDGLVGYAYYPEMVGNTKILRVHNVSKEALQSFATVPVGINENALRLMGVRL